MISVGPDREAAIGLELQLQMAVAQFLSILRAENGAEQLAALRVPINVEPGGVVGMSSPFEHVEPNRIVGAADAHVVRHEIDDAADPVASIGLEHRAIVGFVAELGIELGMISDVVAMRAARPRLEERREIDMADAEATQIGRDLRSLLEPEAAAKLETIGGAGDRHGETMLQRTLHGPNSAPASPIRQNLLAFKDGKRLGAIREVGVQHKLGLAGLPDDAHRLFPEDDSLAAAFELREERVG